MPENEQPTEKPVDREPETEGTRAAREQAQQTNELAEKIQPPHDREATRSDPSPNP
jgi:hypothetical protein